MCIEHLGLYLACDEYPSQYLWGIFLLIFFIIAEAILYILEN